MPAGPFVCASCGKSTPTSFRCRDCFRADRRRQAEADRARRAARDAERRRAERAALEREWCARKAAICLELQHWAAEHGRSPRWREYPDPNRAAYYFGSWREALAAAKLEHGPWDADRIVSALRDDAERRGRPPTHDEWEAADEKRRRPTAGTVKRLFGSWNRALEEAGLGARRSGQNARYLGR